MTAEMILARLVALVPEFAAYWDDPENYFRRDDGSFTSCGAFAQFSGFFRDNYEDLSFGQIADIGAFVSACMESPDDLGDAAATCFLENISTERFRSDFKRYVTGEALRFYSL